MTTEEFCDKAVNFMKTYIENGRRVDVELLKELNDYAVTTDLYQSHKEMADFDDYSYDDVFNHMCLKINSAPFLARFTAILCIPFIYEKFKGETA